MSAPTVVFDLDGTLIDTAPDLVQTLNVIFAREGLAPPPYEAGRNLVGGGAKAMIISALEAERRVFPQPELSECLRNSRALRQSPDRALASFSRTRGRARSEELSPRGMYEQA